MKDVDSLQKIEMLKKQFFNRVNFLKGVYREKIQKIRASIDARHLAQTRKDLGI